MNPDARTDKQPGTFAFVRPAMLGSLRRCLSLCAAALGHGRLTCRMHQRAASNEAVATAEVNLGFCSSEHTHTDEQPWTFAFVLPAPGSLPLSQFMRSLSCPQPWAPNMQHALKHSFE